MNQLDKRIRQKAARENHTIPSSVKASIEKTLDNLPEVKPVAPVRRFSRWAVAAVVFVALFLLPNVSVTYAQALESVPVLGDIVRVITIRHYFYEDDRKEMNIEVPKIEDESNTAADYINRSVDELTAALVNRFYQELEFTGGSGYGSIRTDYAVITDTARWFTLKLTVTETAASSSTYLKYYHIDKEQGKIVQFSDLFASDRYSDILTDEIKRQMREQMNRDDAISYWTNDGEHAEGFTAVRPDSNYYWTEDGDLTIVFDEFEVAPGSMGTPAFSVDRELLTGILKPEYQQKIP